MPALLDRDGRVGWPLLLDAASSISHHSQPSLPDAVLHATASGEAEAADQHSGRNHIAVAAGDN